MRHLQSACQRAFAALAFALFAAPAVAQEYRYRDGRFLETLGGVSIQRADEVTSDEAVRNMPFLPGDRVWTDDAGRAEVVFAEGETLWIAERTKVDSLGRENDERLGIRLFAGAIAARVRRGGPGFEFQVLGGVVTSMGPAAFRIDAFRGETVLTVSEGEVLADLAGQRRTVRGGERMSYADGRADGPFRLTGREDAFDRWWMDRSRELEQMARAHDRLPDELDAYGDELERNGEWVYDEPQGYVYVPRVRVGWSPYTYGRWIYTAYGWTWVDDEPWGFVTSHYGRWGYSSRIGWHWMPRTGFAGAWVAWSSPVGRWNQTIGWCALGFNDRPVGQYGLGGRAVPRGEARGWNYVNRSDMGAAAIQRRRVALSGADAESASTWANGTAPDREFRPVRPSAEDADRTAGSSLAGAVRRDGRGESGPLIHVRPSPGDSQSELRYDPTTTIPNPEARRGKTIGQEGFKEEQGRRSRPDATGLGVILERASRESRESRERADRNQNSRDQRRDAATESSSREGNSRTDESTRPARDPLLDRFFRSITRSSGGTTRSDDDAGRSRDRGREGPEGAAVRSDSDRERRQPAERRPADTRPRSGGDPDRSRPEGVAARSRPRSDPQPPSSSGRSGPSSDERGARRRPPGL